MKLGLMFNYKQKGIETIPRCHKWVFQVIIGKSQTFENYQFDLKIDMLAGYAEHAPATVIH